MPVRMPFTLKPSWLYLLAKYKKASTGRTCFFQQIPVFTCFFCVFQQMVCIRSYHRSAFFSRVLL